MKPNIVCYGEILWDILPGKSLPGGAPMNVAYHLKKLGEQPAMISRIGNDQHGKKLVDIFLEKGMTSGHFQVDEHHPTGLVYAKPNEHNEMSYDIVYPSAWDFIEWEQRFEELVSNAEYFIYGSLTSRAERSKQTLYRLLETAPVKVLDINLRPPYFNQSQLTSLISHSDILKMNQSELELVSGWFGEYHSEQEMISSLQDRFQLETIIVTKGAEGALVNNKGTFHAHPGYVVNVTDTIGSGDSFLAGFLHSIKKTKNHQESLAFACALGALVASLPGGCPEYKVGAILKLFEQPAISTSN